MILFTAQRNVTQLPFEFDSSESWDCDQLISRLLKYEERAPEDWVGGKGYLPHNDIKASLPSNSAAISSHQASWLDSQQPTTPQDTYTESSSRSHEAAVKREPARPVRQDCSHWVDRRGRFLG